MNLNRFKLTFQPKNPKVTQLLTRIPFATCQIVWKLFLFCIQDKHIPEYISRNSDSFQN